MLAAEAAQTGRPAVGQFPESGRPVVLEAPARALAAEVAGCVVAAELAALADLVVPAEAGAVVPGPEHL